ncbi:hypothetical protein GCM10009525_42510 [Streptosporangium amethystogenes subsp. fukuiense]
MVSLTHAGFLCPPTVDRPTDNGGTNLGALRRGEDLSNRVRPSVTISGMITRLSSWRPAC